MGLDILVFAVEQFEIVLIEHRFANMGPHDDVIEPQISVDIDVLFSMVAPSDDVVQSAFVSDMD